MHGEEALVEMMGVPAKECKYAGLLSTMVHLPKQHNVNLVRTERMGCP